MKARAETPGGVAQAAMVSFSKAMGGEFFQKEWQVARKEMADGSLEMEDGEWSGRELLFIFLGSE